MNKTKTTYDRNMQAHLLFGRIYLHEIPPTCNSVRRRSRKSGFRQDIVHCRCISKFLLLTIRYKLAVKEKSRDIHQDDYEIFQWNGYVEVTKVTGLKVCYQLEIM